jgi:topoisomerase (DNA) II binding protein 1
LSSVEHYDPNADAVVAVKVARSEKILGSIAGGKPLLHPSYINACMEADRLLEITEDYIWKESHCKTNSEKTMTQVAQYWYKRRKENPEAGPYAKFCARICEDKSSSKRNAYIRLIEAGGGRIVSEDEDPNIIICDERSASKFTFPPNVPVKVPMFLNDVIINYDDKNVQIFD